MLLDDPSPLVRQAMAEAFASSFDAPAVIVHALAGDQPSVALPILEHSPLLVDADLVDIVATGVDVVQCAIARRYELPAPVCAAIAEVGCVGACLELIDNPRAELAQISLDRIVERFGHIAAVREQLLAIMELPASTRLALVAKLSETLVRFVSARQWLSAERAERVASEACERSTVNIAAQSRGDDLRGLVGHLRDSGQLTAGLILRTLLSGNLELFERSLVELSGIAEGRVSAILHERGGARLNALLVRAGVPETIFPAFRAALEAHHEIGFVGTEDGAARLRRRMVERVLTRCETQSTEAAEPVLTLLRRFATESAREEARQLCDELIADEGFVATLEDRLIAA